MYRTDLRTLWEKARVGCLERTACILSIVKQITSPGGMHETSAQAWYTGKTQRDRVEREVGAGIGMGNTCNSMADSCQCMTEPTTGLWSDWPPASENKWKKKIHPTTLPFDWRIQSIYPYSNHWNVKHYYFHLMKYFLAVL